MKVSKTFEGYGRLGRNWDGGGAFFGEAPTMGDFAWLIMDALEERDSKKIHDLTCGVIKFDARSKTGNFYLAEKCIKYKFDISVEAELIDDMEEEE